MRRKQASPLLKDLLAAVKPGGSTVVGYFGGARLCAKRQPQRCGWSVTQPRSLKSAK